MKVVIDTNVLVNMLNPAKNRDAYLTELLSKIIADKRVICLDEGQRIDKEYAKRLGAWISKAKESIARQLLGFFIAPGGVLYPQKERYKVDKTDDLMKCIGRVIPIEEDMDRVFVYVAARSGATLITDDYDHILSDDGSREERLKKCAKTFANTVIDFLDSGSAKSALDKL